MKSRLYTVHMLDNAAAAGKLVLVKQGFCWPAFFVAVPWALYHRMWWPAAVLAVLQLVIAALAVSAGLSDTQMGVAVLAAALAVGYGADELRAINLERRGYSLEDVVVEASSDRALRRFLDARPGLAARLAAAL